MRIYVALLALVAVVVVSASAADAPRSPFDHVASGEIVVYPIDDLTGGQQQLPERLTGLIQDTVESDSWKGEGRTAALRSTPQRLTVKAPTTVQDSVAQLLHQLRQVRNLFVRMDYQLVSTVKEIDNSKVITHSEQSSALNKSNRIVGLSAAVLENGNETILIDGTDLNIPTITATATVSADRTAVTIAVSANDPVTMKESAKAVRFSLSVNDSADVPIPTPSGTVWLILKPQLVESRWTPIGTAQLIDRG